MVDQPPRGAVVGRTALLSAQYRRPDLDAPEFRIADDAKIATEPVVDFGYGIANAVLTAMVFFGVLWSAMAWLEILGRKIPGFMVYAAIIYSIIMSASMMLFGRALIARIEDRNRTEARLRYEIGAWRENAESIAMVGGADGRGQTHPDHHAACSPRPAPRSSRGRPG